MGQAGSQMRGQQGPSEGDHAGTVLQDSPSDRRSSNRGFLRGCWCGGRTHSKCWFFFSWQWKYTTQLTFSGHLRAWMLMSTSGVITERLPHSAAAAPPPGFFKLTSPKCLLADKGWAFEAGNPNHLKLTDESFSYKPPESFIILVTMLHCNVLPHATMLYSYARCSNTVYSDRMFSLYHTPCQPQIVKIVFDLK